MYKIAGILDPIQDTLAPDVWTSSQKLRPAVRRAIIRRLKTVFPIEDIREIFVIGSITSRQYGEGSDIDINVSITPTEDESKLKTDPVEDINGMEAPGSDRPINFFIQEYYPEVKENYKKAKFGVYDVFGDQWINDPVEKDPKDAPSRKFRPEIRIAQRWLDEFNKIGNKYFEKVRIYKETLNPKVKRRAYKMLRRLWKLTGKIERQRKMAYDIGWGTPRESFQNIIYKTLQDSQYGRLFKQLESYDDFDKINKLIMGYSEQEFEQNQ